MRFHSDTAQKILRFAVDYKLTNNGIFPTYREMAKGLEISSTSVIAYHLMRLVELGYVVKVGARRTYDLSSRFGQYNASWYHVDKALENLQ